MSGFGFKSDLLANLGGRITFLSARHDMVVQNIANMETADYKAQDLKFKGFVDAARADAKTNNVMSQADMEAYGVQADSKPNGNNVIIEDQMAHLADNSVEFMVATEVIKKNLSLLKFAVSDE